MHHGVIYGYRDPDTGKMRYIGQTQNLVKRHKSHLSPSRPLSVDKWLRSLPSPPEPEIICEVMSADHQVFLNDMANRETVAMFHHHTYIASYPNEGGFNRMIPQSKDYQKLGRAYGHLGGSVSGPKNAISGHMQALGHDQGHKNVESGHLRKICTSAVCSAGGRIGGRTNAISGHTARMGRLQGRKNVESGFLAVQLTTLNHTRWHVNREIVNSTCSLCVPLGVI